MVENKNNDDKIKELKIELLKQTSKKKSIKRQIAKLLTLQKNKMDNSTKEKHLAKGSKK